MNENNEFSFDPQLDYSPGSKHRVEAIPDENAPNSSKETAKTTPTTLESVNEPPTVAAAEPVPSTQPRRAVACPPPLPVDACVVVEPGSLVQV